MKKANLNIIWPASGKFFNERWHCPSKEQQAYQNRLHKNLICVRVQVAKSKGSKVASRKRDCEYCRQVTQLSRSSLSERASSWKDYFTIVGSWSRVRRWTLVFGRQAKPRATRQTLLFGFVFHRNFFLERLVQSSKWEDTEKRVSIFCLLVAYVWPYCFIKAFIFKQT